MIRTFRVKVGAMAFTIKGQIKAAVAFKVKSGAYGPILFKLCVEGSLLALMDVLLNAFKIKGQIKAVVAFKVKSCVYGPILFKLCVEVAYWPPFMFCCMAFKIKGQPKVTASFRDEFLDYLYSTFGSQDLYIKCVISRGAGASSGGARSAP